MPAMTLAKSVLHRMNFGNVEENNQCFSDSKRTINYCRYNCAVIARTRQQLSKD